MLSGKDIQALLLALIEERWFVRYAKRRVPFQATSRNESATPLTALPKNQRRPASADGADISSEHQHNFAGQYFQRVALPHRTDRGVGGDQRITLYYRGWGRAQPARTIQITLA